MVKSLDQDSGRSHNIKADVSSFDRVEEFKYLGTKLINQNSINDEIKIRMLAVTRCSICFFHYTNQIFKNSNIHKYNLACCLEKVCEAWSFILAEERRLKFFENMVLRRIFGSKSDEVTWKWKNYIMRSLIICIPHPILFGC